MSFRTWARRQPKLLWGSLGCTLVATANAEYTIALATGMHPLVAGAVPGALDLYVIQALRSDRDVFPAVLTAVAVNVASHLVAGGVLNVSWPIIAAVGAIAPLLLWRVHYLWKTGTDQVRVPESAPEDVPTQVSAGTDRVRVEYAVEGTAPVLYPPVPDYVPEPWFYEGGTGAVSAPVPHPVPEDVPAEYAPGTGDGDDAPDVHPEYLRPGDAEYIGALNAYLDTCLEQQAVPTVRGCKDFCRVGQDRAKRLLAYKGLPEAK